MNDFTEWMEKNRSEDHHWLCKRMEFNSGVSVSVQASEYSYCYPRKHLDYDMYMEFELGFPSEEIAYLMQYAEDPSVPTDTVYGYVPKIVIQRIIDYNGGIKQ